jgi:hypothetical protein
MLLKLLRRLAQPRFRLWLLHHLLQLPVTAVSQPQLEGLSQRVMAAAAGIAAAAHTASIPDRLLLLLPRRCECCRRCSSSCGCRSCCSFLHVAAAAWVQAKLEHRHGCCLLLLLLLRWR